MLRELPVLSGADGSRPLICGPNPFLTPPDPTAAPPMWSTIRRQQATPSRERRRSIMPFVTAVVALAIGLGLWHDDAARKEVASDLERVADRLGALVVEAAIR